MNSLERVQAVIRGKTPDRIPVCLHNFMMAAREAGIPMERYRVDPNAIAQTHLQAWEKYGHDCLLIDTDTTLWRRPWARRRNALPDEPGRIVRPAIRSLAEVGRLKVVNPESQGRIPALLEAVRLLARQVGNEVAIRGNADQMAFDLACMLRGTEEFSDGDGVRAREPGHPRASRDLFREPPRRASRLDQSGRSPDLAGRQPCRPRRSFPPKRSTGLPGRTRHGW